MNQLDRYKLTQDNRMSSRDAVKNLAKNFLLDECGVDITLINIRDEGVSISSFTRLVEHIYQAGYVDGLAQFKEAQDELKSREKKGKALSKHGWFAKQTAAENQVNKTPSL